MLPGVTSILYGLAASALREMISSADMPLRRNAGPNAMSSAAAAATPAERQQLPPQAGALDGEAVFERAALLDRLIDELARPGAATGRGSDLADLATWSDASMALRIAASSVGSYSSR